MCAKLAKHMKEKDHKRPMIAACDIYRPAAIDQLKWLVEKQVYQYLRWVRVTQ